MNNEPVQDSTKRPIAEHLGPDHGQGYHNPSEDYRNISDNYLVSIAISLKRIADCLERTRLGGLLP